MPNDASPSDGNVPLLPAFTPDEQPPQLTKEEIANLSESDYAIYNAKARYWKRLKRLIKREDAKDKPGTGSSWNLPPR